MAAKTIAAFCVAAAMAPPVVGAFIPFGLPGMPGMRSCSQFVGPDHLEVMTSMHDIPVCNGSRRRYDPLEGAWVSEKPRPGEHPPFWICGTGLVTTHVFRL
jgi:hypothetical protein